MRPESSVSMCTQKKKHEKVIFRSESNCDLFYVENQIYSVIMNVFEKPDNLCINYFVHIHSDVVQPLDKVVDFVYRALFIFLCSSQPRRIQFALYLFPFARLRINFT